MTLAELISAVVPARRRPRRVSSRSANARRGRWLHAESLEPRLALSVTMTANEQLLIELINRARANPAAEVSLTPNLSDLNQGLAPGTISTAPKQPLAPHQILINVAGDHSVDMLQRDYFSHYSLNGDSPTDRARAAGYSGNVGENVAWGGSTGTINQLAHVTERHQALFRSPGHRQNMLNDAYREVGTGVRYGVFTYNGTNYNASMVTEDFSSRSGVFFITGVAFSDAVVNNDFYDVGEGAGSIQIVATNNSSGLTYSISTGASGGYALAVPNGTYTIVATGGPIQGQVRHTDVVVASRNIKVDVITTEGTGSDPPPSGGDPDPPNGMALLGRSEGTWWQAQSTGTSLISRAVGSWSNQVQWSHVQTADVDGDGDDDVIGRAGNGQWWVGRNDGTELINEVWGNWSTNVSWQDVVVGDFNNDQRADIAGRAQNGAWWIARSTGSAFVNELWSTWSNRAGWHFVRAGDFNGDGRDDLIARANNGAWWIARSTATSFVNERWGNWAKSASWQDVTVGDFNGDGRDDVAGRSGSTWWVARSTGSELVNVRWTAWSTGSTWRDIRVGDVDGDGRDDLLGRASGDWWVSRTVQGQIVNERWGSWDPFANWEDVLIVDLDRDGLADIAGRLGRNWWVARSNGSQFINGLWGEFPNSGPWHDVMSGDF